VKLVYLGSPEAAVPPLRALVQAGHEIVLVVSQSDKRRGRGSALSPSPVKAAALELGLPVTDAVDDVITAAAAGAELGVVVAYGKLIRPPVLAALPLVNIHFSLLPRWRGAAPVERAVLAGDDVTGVCLMALEAGLDTGPVYRRVETTIGSDESVAELRSRLVAIGTTSMIDALRDGFDSLGPSTPQTGESTYAAKLDPAEFRIDWTKSADEIHRLVRLGVAWTSFRGKRLKITKTLVVAEDMRADGLRADVPGAIHESVVATGDGLLQLATVQPEGRGPMAARDWANGAKPTGDDTLGAAT
jgi:methionyl-tRNA formyltransferase